MEDFIFKNDITQTPKIWGSNLSIGKFHLAINTATDTLKDEYKEQTDWESQKSL